MAWAASWHSGSAVASVDISLSTKYRCCNAQIHRHGAARAESTAKSTCRPREDKHTHRRAGTHGQNQPRPLCGQRHLQHAQQGFATFGSPPLPLLFSLSPGENPSHSEEIKGRRGKAVCGKKSWTVRYYTVFNTSFSIPAESTPRQC